MTRRRTSTDRTDYEVESGHRRAAELLASDRTVHRYGDMQPEDGRDVYSIFMIREDYGGGYVADLWPWDLEQRYRVTYGPHDPSSLWSYEPPAGAMSPGDPQIHKRSIP